MLQLDSSDADGGERIARSVTELLDDLLLAEDGKSKLNEVEPIYPPKQNVGEAHDEILKCGGSEDDIHEDEVTQIAELCGEMDSCLDSLSAWEAAKKRKIAASQTHLPPGRGSHCTTASSNQAFWDSELPSRGRASIDGLIEEEARLLELRAKADSLPKQEEVVRTVPDQLEFSTTHLDSSFEEPLGRTDGFAAWCKEVEGVLDDPGFDPKLKDSIQTCAAIIDARFAECEEAALSPHDANFSEADAQIDEDIKDLEDMLSDCGVIHFKVGICS